MLTRCLVAAALFAAAAPAQNTVCMTGRLLPADTSLCQPAATHAFACGDVLLRSQSIDLDGWIGQLVRVEARNVGVGCPVLEVDSIGPARTTLVKSGSPGLGCPVTFTVCPVLQGGWSLWISVSPGFVPLACRLIPNGLDGTLGLGAPVSWLAGGVLGSCGDYTLSLPVDPIFVGIPLYLQGSHQMVGPVGPLEFTNVECLRIEAAGPPCV